MEHRIFTDGACLGNPGPGGWGAIVCSASGDIQELGGSQSGTTNNRMELLASLEALRTISDRNANIQLYTDSKYVIQGITAWVYGWQRNGFKTAEGKDVSHKDLWLELKAANESFKQKPAWLYIPGHAAYPGNERCDEIAVSFAKGHNIELYRGPRKDYPIDLSVVPDPATAALKKDPNAKPYYLSLIDGSVFRDKDWTSCETRVKGRQGVKFKKVRDAGEEARVLKDWGYNA